MLLYLECSRTVFIIFAILTACPLSWNVVFYTIEYWKTNNLRKFINLIGTILAVIMLYLGAFYNELIKFFGLN